MRVGFIICLLFINLMLGAQNNARIKETVKIFKTYPFSDANPIPTFVKIYPYFRFDGFTTNPVYKTWKVVTLENDFIKLDIMPEIGGKIWNAFDKINKRYFIYNNEVIKFRDIAMRGPWTGGGIEFNYGVIGHTPNTATPVDYVIKKAKDGSVSCIIGLLELITRTRWNVEIKLEKNKAYFTTQSFWHNTTQVEQPYYQWSNAAVYAKNDLKLIYPGNASIGHFGQAMQWPYDSVNKITISDWKNNNYDGSKSFHIMGSHKAFFGSYYKNEDVGMLSFTNRDEKLGRKMFSWSLNDQGKIWEDLLTDSSGQYVEMQSGRIFNQNSIPSSYTPFKQISFSPYSSDSWTEYWLPFKSTSGVKDVNEYGVINIKNGKLYISPLQFLKDTMYIKDSIGNVHYKSLITLKPLQTVVINLPDLNIDNFKISIRGETWHLSDLVVDRPLKTLTDVDYNSFYGKYLIARDNANLNNYDASLKLATESYFLNASFVPNLSLLSRIYFRKMMYDTAFLYAQKAISIDTYDGTANYYYGLSAYKLGKINDAKDGFEVSASNTEFRNAALTELSKIYFIEKDYDKAKKYALKAIFNYAGNIEALQLLVVINRIKNTYDKNIINSIKSLEPLNNFVNFEAYYQSRTADDKSYFLKKITNEFPAQSILELAIWYYNINRENEAKLLLNIGPQVTEIIYWQAYLNKSIELLKKANLQRPDYVFPFRQESLNVFKWAMHLSDDWKPFYYAALIHKAKDNNSNAKELLNKINDNPKFSPFYIIMALNADKNKVEKYLLNAVKYSPEEWRYTNYLTKYYLSQNLYTKALETIRPFFKKHNDNYIIGTLYLKTLLRNNLYKEANDLSEQINILPFEGAWEGRRLYEETKILSAIEQLSVNNYNNAEKYIREAELWPRNMGVGKPYDNMIDNRAEDFLMALLLIKTHKTKEAEEYFKKIAHSKQSISSNNTLFQIAALNFLKHDANAQNLYADWIKRNDNESKKQWANNIIANKISDNIDVDIYKSVIQNNSEIEDSRLF